MTLQRSDILHCLPSVNNAVKDLFLLFKILKVTAFHNNAHSEKVIINTELVRSTSTTSIPHAHIGHESNYSRPKHATLEVMQDFFFSKQCVAINGM